MLRWKPSWWRPSTYWGKCKEITREVLLVFIHTYKNIGKKCSFPHCWYFIPLSPYSVCLPQLSSARQNQTNKQDLKRILGNQEIIPVLNSRRWNTSECQEEIQEYWQTYMNSSSTGGCFWFIITSRSAVVYLLASTPAVRTPIGATKKIRLHSYLTFTWFINWSLTICQRWLRL